MAAPSKPWSDIADQSIDSDSLIDFVLLSGIRDDLVWLKEVLGGTSVGHNHDGTNGASVGGQQFLLLDRDTMTTSQGFVTVAKTLIYIPEDLTTIEYYARICVELTGRADMRLIRGTVIGSTVLGLTDSTIYAFHGPGTIDVSDLWGWLEFEIQLSHTTGAYNAYMDKAVARLT